MNILRPIRVVFVMTQVPCVVSLILWSILFLSGLLQPDSICPQPPAGFNETFTALDELRRSPWYEYLQEIYSDDQLEFPLSMKDFWVVQTRLLPPSLRDQIKEIPPLPCGHLGLFSALDSHAPADSSLIYNYQYSNLPPCRQLWGYPVYALFPRCYAADDDFYLLSGFKSNTNVEIMHGADVQGAPIWFYHMKGSGNWLNLGRTIAFPDHDAAFDHFALSSRAKSALGAEADYYFGVLTDVAKRDYDTIQFTSRSEGIYKFEILDVRHRQNGTGSCRGDIRTRGRQPCACDSKLPYQNCKVSEYHLPWTAS